VRRAQIVRIRVADRARISRDHCPTYTIYADVHVHARRRMGPTVSLRARHDAADLPNVRRFQLNSDRLIIATIEGGTFDVTCRDEFVPQNRRTTE